MKRILAINPGSTSTKIAVYDGENPEWVESILHQPDELKPYPSIYDQLEMRMRCIRETMAKHGVAPESLSAVVARGGLLPPVQAGAYAVNRALLEQLRYRPRQEHASNLGAALADAIASPVGIPAYIYDPVTVDEMIPLVRVTGLKEMKRYGIGHNLNMRAAAIRYAKEKGVPYDSVDVIVAHLGGGITFSLHSKGRIIDMISDDEGSFSPERAGGLPCFQLVHMATGGDYDDRSLMKKLQRDGGLMAYFGTSDTREVEKRVLSGDEEAALVYEAMALNVAKSIAKLAATVSGKVDAVILTGGIAYSQHFTDLVSGRVQFIAPVVVYAGENEMESLAKGALRVLLGEETAREFVAPAS